MLGLVLLLMAPLKSLLLLRVAFVDVGVVVVGGGRVFLGPRDQIFTKSISNGVNSSG